MSTIDIHVKIQTNPPPIGLKHRVGVWLHRLAAKIDGKAYARFDLRCNAPLPPQQELTRAFELGTQRTCDLIAASARIHMVDRVMMDTCPGLWQEDGR